MSKNTKIIIVIALLIIAGGVYFFYARSEIDNGLVKNENSIADNSFPVAVQNAPQEIVWNRYENRETGIAFNYPPGTSVSEGTYNGQNGAVFSTSVYDPALNTTIFSHLLEGSACPYSGVVGNEEMIASSTFKHVTDDYGDKFLYERYSTDKNGGCYRINLIYDRNIPSSKEKVFNILKSFRFTEI